MLILPDDTPAHVYHILFLHWRIGNGSCRESVPFSRPGSPLWVEQHGPGLGLSGCLESKQLSLSTQRVDEGSGTCISYLDYLFKNRHVETEQDLLFPACKPRRVGVQSDVVNSILMLEHQ